MSRLIIVSNRVFLPASSQRAPGGLAIGLLSALQQHGGIWCGWSGCVNDASDNQFNRHSEGGVEYLTVDLNRSEYDNYYRGFSNELMWPICHYVLGFVRYHREYYQGYRAVNRKFAEGLKKVIEPTDVIWIHDYHLLPLAYELRLLGVVNPIGFFLHVPFPSYGMLRSLPVAAELMKFLTYCNVVGFQTRDDCIDFLDSISHFYHVERSLPGTTVTVEGRSFFCHEYPIGVDFKAIKRVVEKGDASLQESFAGNHYQRIIGADRIDYSKGLLERMSAYKTLLRLYPRFHRQVVMMQVATLSRSDSCEYKELRHQLETAVANINGEFSDIDWLPIHYFNKSIKHDRLMAVFNRAQLCLVTSLRDGMNLVSKEFVAAQSADDPGVLVLSELAGSAKQLDGALLINPYDTAAIAEAMVVALEMPLGERIERYQSMLVSVKREDISHWCSSFLVQLNSSVHRHEVGDVNY